MNYILHLNRAFEKIYEDQRFSAFHVSLYYSLFQYWNMARFRNPISISRSELMYASKIGSINTYIRCMKDLDAWEYIKYEPSFNPHKASQVNLFNFSNCNNNSKTNGIDISNNKAGSKAAEQSGETVVIPYTNNTNSINTINNTNKRESKKTSPKKNLSFKKEIDNEKSEKKSDSPVLSKTEESGQEKKEKSSGQKEKLGRRAESRRQRPLLLEVQTYFQQNNWPAIEADKYYNHYQSNGWLVAGKTPMVDWQASAAKWMLNAEKFTLKSKTGELRSQSVVAGKNYNEPL